MRGLEKTIERLKRTNDLYCKINEHCSHALVDLKETPYFDAVVENFGPCLAKDKAKIDLKRIYRAAFHKKSGSLLIATRGVSYLSRSPLTMMPYITHHIAISLYKPGLGLESINVGIVGDIYSQSVIVRGESACPPAFLFSSERCNCHYQWSSVKELAAHLNPVEVPKNLDMHAHEKWIQEQFSSVDDKIISKSRGKGVLMIHLDSQAGMGSGYTQGEFVTDLYNRALMRQLGENCVEQTYDTTLKGGYEALGVCPDSRREENEAGYEIPGIICQWLKVNRQLIVLSNNRFKLKQFQEHGFDVTRVKSIGRVSEAGQREAKERGRDFQHLDMDGEEITFEEELSRLKKEFQLA